MKTKIFEFDPVIYPFKVHVSKEFDVELLKKRYKAMDAENNPKPITDEFDVNDTTTARTIELLYDKKGRDMWGYLVLLYKDDYTSGQLAHEAVHVANMYLQQLGFTTPAAYNDEPYAYFVQWVTDCIASVLNDKPEEMKGTFCCNYDPEKGLEALSEVHSKVIDEMIKVVRDAEDM